jgi:hypothetical protein
MFVKKVFQLVRPFLANLQSLEIFGKQCTQKKFFAKYFYKLVV